MINAWEYKKEYNSLKRNILKSIDNVFKNGKLFFGKETKKFEKNFVKLNNSKYGISVANGTNALLIALKALNIGNGDEVITVSNTAIATASAITSSGAKIRFVDVKDDYLIDHNKIEKCINKKTKAIIVVHLYGQACEMKEILKIKKKYKIKIIEDCAQAQGAKYRGLKVGNFGDFGCFSFYPTKILGAYGDGGFVTTNDNKLYRKIRRIRFFGIENIDKKNRWNNIYYSNEHGINSRLSEVQSAILNVKLKYVDKNIVLRKKIAKIYDRLLTNKDLIKPKINKYNSHVFHLYVVAYKKRDLLIKFLKRKKIFVTIQYPVPIHKMNAFKKNLYANDVKNLDKTVNNCKYIFSLPLYPTIKKNDQLMIINEINKFIKKN